MKFSVQLAVFGLSALAAAQFDALPACAKGCATSSLPASCNLDVKCICANSAFISGISCCVKNACSPADQQTTLQVAQQLCSTVQVTLPSAASCPGGSSAPASEASSASSSAASPPASPPASSASSPASSSSHEASTASSGSATIASSQSSTASAGGSSGSSVAGAATGTPSASSKSPSSTGGAVKDLGSNLGAIGAAVAALYLI